MAMTQKEMDKMPMKNRDIKVLSDAQKRIAQTAEPFDKITGADFKKLQKEKKGR